jgi:hypothetical protein
MQNKLLIVPISECLDLAFAGLLLCMPLSKLNKCDEKSDEIARSKVSQ